MSKTVKTTVSSTIGTLVEWYDFYIYGLSATLIFPKIFFPEVNPTIAVLTGFASYLIAFFFRPLGALLFGYLGDKYGRVQVLAYSLLLMGVSTVAIGLLPTYHQIGVWAPIALLTLRVIQGFAVGGEWGSATTMTFEHTPPHRRGLAGGFIQLTVPSALLLSTAVFGGVLGFYGEATTIEWAWRIPFLLSLLMLLIGVYVRLYLPEGDEFLKTSKAHNPLKETFKEFRHTILHVALARLFQNTMFNTISLFFITYLTTKLGIPKSVGLDAMMIGAGSSIVFILIWASLSDVFPRKGIMFIGIMGMIFILPSLFIGLHSLQFSALVAVFIGAFFAHDAMYGVQASLIPEQFPARVRLSGTSLGYNIGAGLAGVLSLLVPIILEFRGEIFDVVVFLALTGLISAYSCYKLK